MELLESAVPVSRSRLWRLQRDYFDRTSVAAWGQGPVPLHVTSNPLIARAYVQILLGYFRDLAAAGELDAASPLYVMELGAGSGRFSYLFRRALDELLARSIVHDLRVVLIMTDFVAANVEHWRGREEFSASIAAGNLDFALFDLEHDQSLHLLQSNLTLTPGTPKNPMIFIANYVFDGIPQDVFRIENGVAEEFLAQLQHDGDQNFSVEFQRKPISPDHYPDPALNNILASFLTRSGTISMPVAALACLRNLRALSSGRMLLLTADKGYGEATLKANASAPIVAQHGSCSMMVNFAALGQWVRAHGGAEFHPAHAPTALYAAAFAFGLETFPECNLAYSSAIDHGGPDDFTALPAAAALCGNALSWDQAINLLRLSGWDNQLLPDLLPIFRTQLDTASPEQIAALHQAIEQLDGRYFPIGESHDLAFDLGVLLLQTGAYHAAAAQFHKSQHRFGADASCLINLALCYWRTNRPRDASKILTAGLRCDPTNPTGLLLQKHLEPAL
jgi:tetratricopeptide (TPR) repeat protein